VSGDDHGHTGEARPSRLFNADAYPASAFHVKRGDRIEIRTPDGGSEVVEVQDIDDGPGGSFTLILSEVSS
jgi:hypothetical protein